MKKKMGREKNGSGFYQGAEGAEGTPGGDAAIVPPKLRFHPARTVVVGTVVWVSTREEYQISAPHRTIVFWWSWLPFLLGYQDS